MKLEKKYKDKIVLAKGQFIPAHYHKEDIETYFILEGQGIVSTGTIEDEDVVWNTEKEVNTGDCFTIYPREVHGFKNISEKTLRIIDIIKILPKFHPTWGFYSFVIINFVI